MKVNSIFFLSGVLFLFFSAGAFGDDAAAPEETRTQDCGFFRAARISEDVLAKKNEGWSPFGLPIVNYTSDVGFGGGIIVGGFYNGYRDDPRFEYTPYLAQVSFQAYASTLGVQDHFISTDLPGIFGMPVRIKCGAMYSELLNANYYGIGNDTARDAPGFSPENKKYNQYIFHSYSAYCNGYLSVLKYLKLNLGYQLKYMAVISWKGREFDEGGDDIRSGPTRIDEDAEVSGRKRKGTLGVARFGIGFDSRDFEPDPRRGFLAAVVCKVASPYLGADFNFARTTAEARGFFTPCDGVTVASRIAWTHMSGTMPVNEIGIFSFFGGDEPGLGGNRTLRGYPRQRFIGYTMTLGGIEARWEFAEFRLFGQRFSVKVLAFTDTGRVYDRPEDSMRQWHGYHWSFGPGAVLTYNQSAILHFYAGFSREDIRYSLDFNHAF